MYLVAFTEHCQGSLVEQLIIVLFIIYFLYYYNLEAIDENFFAKLIFLGTILIRVVPGLIRLSSAYQTIKFAAIRSRKYLRIS